MYANEPFYLQTGIYFLTFSAENVIIRYKRNSSKFRLSRCGGRMETVMAKTIQQILNLIKEKGIKMVDFKMVDINGQYRHVTILAENFSEETMK